MTQSIQVLVVDKQPLFRVGLRNELASHYQVSECANIQQAYPWQPEKMPDVIFLGSNIAGFSLPNTLLEWQQCFPTSHFIIMLSETKEICDHLLGYGAVGCLLKDDPSEHFIQAVAAVAMGNTWFKPSILQQVITAKTKPLTPIVTLTEREITVLRLVMTGKTNPDIAMTIHVAPRTVGNILEGIYTKLDVHTRTEAVAKALQLRLLEG